MESSPQPPRQRSRRSDRYQQQTEQMSNQQPNAQQAIPTPRGLQSNQTAYHQPNVQQGIPTPRVLQEQTPYPQPSVQQGIPIPRALQSNQTAYHQPNVQQGIPTPRVLQQEQTPYPQPNVQQGIPTPRVLQEQTAYPQPNAQQGIPTPRVLQQDRSAYAPSQRPYVPAPPPITAEPPRQRRRPMMDEPADVYPAQEEKPRLPGWMIGSLTGAFLLVLALITAIALMQAYLKTEADKQEAAYRSTLSYYHVLDGNDGTMSVTYQDLIEYYAAEYNLQPAFVTAIIRNESSFRTEAESSVGARGLMQLMSDTAEWIAGKLDVDNFHFDMMWNAEDNIRFGCWYLGYLSRLFRGDAVAVAAAYHAGQTTVTGWMSNRSISPDGVTLPLANLADGPTKTYAGRVTQAYGIYQALLYPDQPFQAPQSVQTSVPARPDGPDSILESHIER